LVDDDGGEAQLDIAMAIQQVGDVLDIPLKQSDVRFPSGSSLVWMASNPRALMTRASLAGNCASTRNAIMRCGRSA
jgi:hypothetical protein